MSAILLALACFLLRAQASPPGPAVGTTDAVRSPSHERPNVLVLIADDQAVGVTGYEGHPWSRTPAIDALAREGVVFRDAFVTTPLCSPSRASFLTGRYARSHGIVGNRSALPDGVPTFASLLTEAGYDSAYVGKWHLGREAGLRPGFAYTASFGGQGTYRSNAFLIGDDQGTREVEHRGWVDDVTTDLAVEFLRRPREQPFLLVVGFKGPHRPHLPPPRHARDFEERRVRTPDNARAYPPFPLYHELKEDRKDRREGRPARERGEERNASPWRGGFKSTYQERLRNYFQVLAGLDDNVARLRGVLEELDALDDTVVVYTSDNGFCLGHHGMVGKAVLYEEGGARAARRALPAPLRAAQRRGPGGQRRPGADAARAGRPAERPRWRSRARASCPGSRVRRTARQPSGARCCSSTTAAPASTRTARRRSRCERAAGS